VKVQDPPPLSVRPVPVQRLDYSDPRRGRPGLVTAIGVMSIVVASLSMLSSLGTGGQAVGLIYVSRMAGSMPVTSTTTTSGSGSTVVAGSMSIPGSASAATAPATAPSTTLTPAEVQQVISKVRSNLGAKNLNAAQVASLQAALQNPSQWLVTPGTAWSPVTSASIESDGTADLDLSGGSIEIDSNGAVVFQFSSSTSTFNMPRVGLWPCILGLFDGVASLGLAVWVLIAGIAALRNSRRAFRMHKIYAWAKIPMSIVGGIAYWWLMSQFIRGMAGAAASATNWVFGLYAGVFAALGCAYPIGLLIATHTKTVRDYYRTMTTSAWDV
jgi:hypothetical protein